jgi:hypothetical protein
MKPEFHCDDQWWVSPSNVTDDVRRSFSLSRRVQIHDATLRDGEQTSLLETSRQAVQGYGRSHHPHWRHRVRVAPV